MHTAMASPKEFSWLRIAGCCMLLFVSSWNYGTFATTEADDFFVDAPELREILLGGFGHSRNHLQPAGKTNARDYIRDFTGDKYLTEQSYEATIDSKSETGINFLYILRGSEWGSSDDRPMVVGAHYDTRADTNTPGVDDNGSGMTALLAAAEYITNFLAERNYTLKYTLMFVAFDFEETTDDADTSFHICLGSRVFVDEYLVPTILDAYDIDPENFQGALILETTMNWDDREGSQSLPPGFGQLFPEAESGIEADGMRGNFISIIGRGNDIGLAEDFEKHWDDSAQSDKYKAWVFELPFSDRPSDLPDQIADAVGDFFRSDHYRFWDHGDGKGLKSIMITDTANFRVNCDSQQCGQSCYHQVCDNLDTVNDDKLTFMAKITHVVIKMALDASEPGAAGTSAAARTFSTTPQYITMATILWMLSKLELQ